MRERLILAVAAVLLLESNVFGYTRKYKIEGYSDKISYTQGETAYFSVSLGEGYENDTLVFNYEVFRFGATTDLYAVGTDSAYYHILNLQQPYNNTWDTTFVMEIHRDWPSGVYGARISLNDSFYSYIPFVVKEDTAAVSSNILFQTTSTTWQAYNYYGGGSFYSNTCGSVMRDSISYDRPFSSALGMYGHPRYAVDDGKACVYPPWEADLHGGMVDSIGMTRFFHFEYYMIHWLESNGYALEYCDNTDIDRWYGGPDNKLLNYRLFISCGHDEYWSMNMRKNVEWSFRDGGTAADPKNLAFFSANDCYRKIRFPTSNKRLMSITRGGADEEWHKNPVTIDNPGPEERMIGSRSVCVGSYFTLADGPLTRNIDPPNPNPLQSDPEYWIYEDVMWQGENTYGVGRYFTNRQQSSNTPPGYNTPGRIGLAGFEVQARDNVINQNNGFPFVIPEELSDQSEIKVLADYTDNITGSNNTSQATYFCVPPDSGFSKRYEVFSSGGIQWSWGLLEGSEVDPGGRAPKITRNIINELARIRPLDNISSNSVWRTNVDITTPIEVEAGATLTINPGVKIRFHEEGALVIRGTLIARGSVSDSIKFLPASDYPVPGAWPGIVVEEGGQILLAYCAVRYAGDAIETQKNSNIEIENCAIANSGRSGVTAIYPNRLSVSHSQFFNNNHHAVSVANASAETIDLNHLEISGVNRYGIRYFGNPPDIAIPRIDSVTITYVPGPNETPPSVYGIEFGVDESGNRPAGLISNVYISGYKDGIHLSNTAEGTRVGPGVSCENNTNGIYLDNSQVEINGTGGVNVFESNLSRGLLAYYSSGKVRYSRFAASPVCIDIERDGEVLDFGRESPQEEWGNNSIIAEPGITNILFYAEQCGIVYPAQLNWWGSLDSVYIDSMTSGCVLWNPFLSDPPQTEIFESEDKILPCELTLEDPYPNPFNQHVTISFILPRAAVVSVTIYNILGQEIRELYDRSTGTGSTSVIWDGRNDYGEAVSSGVYFCVVRAEDGARVQKLLFLK